ncbi:MAG TPA: 8-oxoguanine deaminase [Pseudonocardiaceae bacterium]|jgi:cytosine/adenosine deaminase-related metal-dependent hydrolase
MTAAVSRLVIESAAVATVDTADWRAGAGTEHSSGHVVVEDGVITAVGSGPAPQGSGADATRIDGHGALLVTPGLVNTHHHLYQWASRGLAQQATLFEWLVALYPVWAGLDESIEYAAASAGLAALAGSGCTAVADHHYVYPRGAGDLDAALVAAAGRIGVRLQLVRGSMDSGRSGGGLPPDDLVEDTEQALAGTEAAIAAHHDPTPRAMVRVSVGPCSPFSASERLMREAASLARRHGVRLHTHLAETLDEEKHCVDRFGRTPIEYADDLGWLGPDVWLAHGIHVAENAIKHLGGTGTGIAHCPSSNARLGAGIAPVVPLLTAGSPVGLGVDGAASNEHGGLGHELRQAMLLARLRSGPDALTARQALWLGTMGGARCLGRERELGSIEVGKLADLAVWRLDGLGHAGIADPLAALVFGPLPPLELLLVGGRTIVERGHLSTVDEQLLATELAAASHRLLTRADRHGG